MLRNYYGLLRTTTEQLQETATRTIPTDHFYELLLRTTIVDQYYGPLQETATMTTATMTMPTAIAVLDDRILPSDY